MGYTTPSEVAQAVVRAIQYNEVGYWEEKGSYWGRLEDVVCKDVSPTMENQMEKKVENVMEIGVSYLLRQVRKLLCAAVPLPLHVLTQTQLEYEAASP